MEFSQRFREVLDRLRICGTLIFVGALFLVSIAGVPYAAADYAMRILKSHRIESSWVVTGAEIIQSSSTWGCSRVGTRYSGGVAYKYSVNGVQYVNDKVSLEGSCGSLRDAEREVAEHPVGAFKHVYYNPQDPSDSVLVGGLIGTSTYVTFAITLTFVAAGIFYLWRLVREVRSR